MVKGGENMKEQIKKIADIMELNCPKQDDGICPKCPLVDHLAAARLDIPADKDAQLGEEVSKLLCPTGKSLVMHSRWLSKTQNGVHVNDVVNNLILWADENIGEVLSR